MFGRWGSRFDEKAAREQAGYPVRWFGVGLEVVGLPMTVPLHSTWRGGVVWPFSAFLEFQATHGGELLTLDEVQVGQAYKLYMTSRCGLWRRAFTGRIVGVAGFVSRMPILMDLGAAFDALVVWPTVLNRALLWRVISVVTNHSVCGFVATSGRSGFGIRVGVEGLGTSEMQSRLDLALRSRHDGYARLCRQMGQPCLELCMLPRGTFERFESAQLREGRVMGEWEQPTFVDATTFERFEAGWETR